MDQEIGGLKQILEDNQQTISRLSTMVNTQKVRLSEKEKEIEMLRTQCNDFIRAGEIMQQSETTGDRAIILSESERSTVRQLFNALKVVSEKQEKYEMSEQFQQRLRRQCDTLQELRRKYGNSAHYKMESTRAKTADHSQMPETPCGASTDYEMQINAFSPITWKPSARVSYQSRGAKIEENANLRVDTGPSPSGFDTLAAAKKKKC